MHTCNVSILRVHFRRTLQFSARRVYDWVCWHGSVEYHCISLHMPAKKKNNSNMFQPSRTNKRAMAAMIFVAKTGVWPICFRHLFDKWPQERPCQGGCCNQSGSLRSTFFPLAMSCPVTNDGDHKSTKSKGS